MVRHEFLGSYRRQRATHSVGTTVTADFDDCIYGRKYIKKENRIQILLSKGAAKNAALILMG